MVTRFEGGARPQSCRAADHPQEILFVRPHDLPVTKSNG
jgi:hypothetical protein